MPLLEESLYIKKMDGLMWYLVRTMPRSESHAESLFLRNGIPYYLPKYNKNYVNTVTAKNGKKYFYKRPAVLVPMFPGYIFAALDLSSISETRKDRHIAQVCLHTNYTEDELISDLNKVKDFEFLAKSNKIEIKPTIDVGKRVTIIRGPFMGWEGIVERRVDHNLIWIRTQTIGFSMAMELAMADCELVEG